MEKSIAGAIGMHAFSINSSCCEHVLLRSATSCSEQVRDLRRLDTAANASVVSVC